MQRLAARTSNTYGKTPGDLGRVLHDITTVEPPLRQAADHEVRTTMPLNEVVTAILRLVGARQGAYCLSWAGDRPCESVPGRPGLIRYGSRPKGQW